MAHYWPECPKLDPGRAQMWMGTLRRRFKDEGEDGIRKSYGDTPADFLAKEVRHAKCTTHVCVSKEGLWPECPELSVKAKMESLEVLNKVVANNAKRLTIDEMVTRLQQDFGDQAAAYWLLSKTGTKT
jgi:hypothetical protein